jgi:hypothetical protein
LSYRGFSGAEKPPPSYENARRFRKDFVSNAKSRGCTPDVGQFSLREKISLIGSPAKTKIFPYGIGKTVVLKISLSKKSTPSPVANSKKTDCVFFGVKSDGETVENAT